MSSDSALHCENDIAPISFYSKRKNVISYFTKKSKVVSNRNDWKIRFGQLKDNAMKPLHFVPNPSSSGN